MRHGYREHRPSARLARYVHSFWTVRVSRPPRETARVVPDGCADIIIEASGASIEAIGTMLRPKLVPHPPGLELVAVRFRPEGARPFLGVPMHEITDLRVELAITRRLAAAGIPERIAAAPHGWQRVAILEEALLEQLQRTPEPDALVAAGSGLIESACGCVAIGAIAAELGVGRRQLERRFRTAVGVSPKQLAQIVRVRTAADSLRRLRLRDTARTAARPGSLRDLALDLGFSDQPHFNRQFKRYVGTNPLAFARE